jgi:RND family efflux transporter MFP subunit
VAESEIKQAPAREEPLKATPMLPGSVAALTPRPRWPIRGFLITCVVAALAAWLGHISWSLYMGTPWTRDGTVRVYVVTMAPEIAGRIVAFPVTDNEYVKKGAVLMVIDPINYQVAVRLGEAAVQRALATMTNAELEARRRAQLPNSVVNLEQKQIYSTQVVVAQAEYQQALANLDLARANLERTVIHSPVNGWVTNLLTQRGDYANIGQNVVSVVDADSFWIDAYFEETLLGPIRVGDPARVKLLAYPTVVRGHVESIARAISVPNALPNGQGVATVNPIFTWVRLAQRIPVRVHLDDVPKDLMLAAGMTATVEIEPRSPQPAPKAPSR